MGRQPSPGQLVHSDSGYVSQPTLLESQQSTTTAAGYAMSQPLLESQQSMTAAAVDYEDAETVDYKSPASTPPPPPSVNPLFPLVNGHVTTGKVTSFIHEATCTLKSYVIIGIRVCRYSQEGV